jgi:hypothetical protein
MSANQSRLLGVALLLSAIAVLVRLGGGGDAGDRSDDKVAQDALARKHELEQSYAKSRARLEAGPYISSSKHISDSEEIQTIVIPESMSEELDTRCIVYKNAELKTASISCTGILFRHSSAPS